MRYLEFSLPRIQELIAADEPAFQRALERHRQTLEQRLRDDQFRLSILDELRAQPSAGSNPGDVRVRRLGLRRLVAVRIRTNLERLSGELSRGFSSLLHAVGVDAADPRGERFTLIQKWTVDGRRLELHAAVPRPLRLAASEEFEMIDVPAGSYACLVHRGSHFEMVRAYSALRAWGTQHGREWVGSPLQVYRVGVRETLDSQRFETEIRWRVR